MATLVEVVLTLSKVDIPVLEESRRLVRKGIGVNLLSGTSCDLAGVPTTALQAFVIPERMVPDQV